MLAFVAATGARSVVMTDTIIGCPHEEGIDYQGPTCPVCYTNLLLKGKEYYHCCHSNLTRARWIGSCRSKKRFMFTT